MSEKRIYELTAQNALNSDDYLAVDKSGNSTAKKVPASVIVDQFADMNNILGAKNLLPNNAVTVVLRGITWTINSDGTITANGTATGGDSTLYYVSSTNDSTVGITIPAGKYTYSCLTTEGSDRTYRSEIYNLTNPSRIGWDYGEGVTFTRSEDTKVLGSINIRSGATVSNITFKPMLRPAAVDNSYVPFAKSNKQLTEDVTALNSAITTLENGFYSDCGSIGTNQFDLSVTGKQAILNFHFSNASANANVDLAQTIPEGYRPSGEISRTFTGCNSSGTGMVVGFKVKSTGKMCFTTAVNGLYGSGSYAWKIT